MLIVEKKPILLISSSTCLLQRLYSVLVQNNPRPRPLIQGLDILSVPPPSVTSCLSFFSCKSTLFWLADPHKQKVKTVSGSQTELFAWRYWGYQLLLTSYSTKSRKAAGTMTWVRVVTVYIQDMRENEENHNKFPLTFPQLVLAVCYCVINQLLTLSFPLCLCVSVLAIQNGQCFGCQLPQPTTTSLGRHSCPWLDGASGLWDASSFRSYTPDWGNLCSAAGVRKCFAQSRGVWRVSSEVQR